MPNYGGSKSSGSGGGFDLTQARDGILVKFGNQVSTVLLEDIPGINIRHKDGQEGNPLFEVEWWLGRKIHADLAVAGTIPIQCRAALFVPNRIIITMARGEPTTINAAFYTAPVAGRGELISEVPNSRWKTLTDDLKIIDLKLDTARRSFDYLDLIVSTPNDQPLRASVWIFGETLISSDIRGIAF